MLAYFDRAFAAEAERLRRWQQAITASSERGQHSYNSMAERRRDEVAAMSTLVNMLRDEFSQNGRGSMKAECWPDVAAPFDAAAASGGYGKFYVRLSGNLPLDAEEALRQNLVLAVGNPTMVKRMAIESASHSRFMLYFSISALLDAYAKYIERYELRAAESVLRAGQEAISAQLRAIADDLGNLGNSVP